MSETIDLGTPDLLCRVDGNVGILSMNRPEARNALSEGIYQGLAAGLARFATDTTVRAVMITGENGAFCAGGDVKGFSARHKAQAEGAAPPPPEAVIADLRRRQREVSLTIHHYPKPVVAAIPGAAAGAGLSIALACDMRIAAERAIIITAFSNIGASGDFGGSYFLTQLVGPAKAKELYMLSPRLRGADAAAVGIVNQVLPDEGFEDAAVAWCQTLAERSPIAMAYIKENVNRALIADAATCLEGEAAAMIRTMSTQDHKEAVAAFLEKRPAVFRGE